MRIQHNIMAMNSYRNYMGNSGALAKNLEKLSSGYRINRAGDDAAGLAISEKMRAQITGLDAAQKNVNDGISLVKTAEGAMQEVHDMLNRMEYLATQSANGTYDSKVDRPNLQKEVEALKEEINRISNSANFNGIKLLDGSLQGVSTPGTSVERTTAVTLSSFNTRVDAITTAVRTQFEVALDGFNATLNSGSTTGTFDLVVGGTTINLTATGTTNTGEKVDATKLSFTTTGLTQVAINSVTYDVTLSNEKLTFTLAKDPTTAAELKADFTVSFASDTGMAFSSTENKINSTTQKTTSGVIETSGTPATATFELTADMVDDATITIFGETFTFDKTENGSAGGGANGDYQNNNIHVKDLLDAQGNIDSTKLGEVANRLVQAAGNNGTISADFTIGTSGTTITLQSLTSRTNTDTPLDTEAKVKDLVKYTKTQSSDGKNSQGLRLQIGDTSDEFNQLKLRIGDMHTDAMGTEGGKKIDDVDISSQDGAREAIDIIKNAINYVSNIRGDLGAAQNRLEHTSKNLSVMEENIQNAESAIRDVDVADEMTQYTKNNILLQSAQAMLAQANQMPQGVLQLLQ